MRVLLVDDDHPTRLICRRVLNRIGGEALVIEEAADARSAMEKLRSGAWDGVLCDYRLGAITGIDVLAVARDVQPDAYRALMSGFADPSLADVARERAGIHAFIEKPMTSREFEDVLRDRFLAPMGVARPREG